MDADSREEFSLIYFRIPGKAVGKGRPRFTKNGHTFTPDSTRDYEDLIRAMYRVKYKGKPTEEPVSVTINVYTAPAKSLSKKKRAELQLKSPMKKPDLDNVAKIVLDALNKVAWVDDTQVVSLKVRRMWSNEEYVCVTIFTEDEVWREKE